MTVFLTAKVYDEVIKVVNVVNVEVSVFGYLGIFVWVSVRVALEKKHYSVSMKLCETLYTYLNCAHIHTAVCTV